MCDENEEPSVLDSPPVWPVVITWDDQGVVTVDVGELNSYEAWGVVVAAANALAERIPSVRVRQGGSDVDDDEDDD